VNASGFDDVGDAGRIRADFLVNAFKGQPPTKVYEIRGPVANKGILVEGGLRIIVLLGLIRRYRGQLHLIRGYITMKYSTVKRLGKTECNNKSELPQLGLWQINFLRAAFCPSRRKSNWITRTRRETDETFDATASSIKKGLF